MAGQSIYVPLEKEEITALYKMTEASCRSIRDQIRYLVRKEAEQLGLLPALDSPQPRTAQHGIGTAIDLSNLNEQARYLLAEATRVDALMPALLIHSASLDFSAIFAEVQQALKNLSTTFPELFPEEEASDAAAK